MSAPLTEREERLIACVEWLANSVHEAHHMVTTNAAGFTVKVPDDQRRARVDCGSAICSYATKLIDDARRTDSQAPA